MCSEVESIQCQIPVPPFSFILDQNSNQTWQSPTAPLLSGILPFATVWTKARCRKCSWALHAVAFHCKSSTFILYQQKKRCLGESLRRLQHPRFVSQISEHKLHRRFEFLTVLKPFSSTSTWKVKLCSEQTWYNATVEYMMHALHPRTDWQNLLAPFCRWLHFGCLLVSEAAER